MNSDETALVRQGTASTAIDKVQITNNQAIFQ